MWADGTKYIGEFKEDNRSGTGKCICLDGSSYDGSWKNDKRNGQGT